MTDNPGTISWWAILVLWMAGLTPVLYTLRKLRQDRRERWRERHPDPDAVMAQRQLYADGEFRRHWTRRSPIDVHMDRVDLECGHWVGHFVGRPLEREELIECDDCAREYLKSAQKGLNKAK